ncbi:peptidase M4 [Anopheles sinensis]|uniref:Peptidase M4 n=1 Tax=Anopheles sinensis TaxID=74873 RepID=A0A084WUX0_ANOSI|nr:peptidase M4 [Anopheles sinensis]
MSATLNKTIFCCIKPLRYGELLAFARNEPRHGPCRKANHKDHNSRTLRSHGVEPVEICAPSDHRTIFFTLAGVEKDEEEWKNVAGLKLRNNSIE